MKFTSFQRAADAGGGKIERRGLVVGAGVAGVAAVAVHLMRGRVADAPELVVAKAAPSREAGYQVTPHVLRYYETAKS